MGRVDAEVKAYMKRAERSLAVAWHNFEDEYWAESLSRAYYAMFYAAHALICTKGLTTSKHSGVIAMVGEHFAKPGLIERRLHRSLIDMFDERQVADYEVLLDISKERAQAGIDAAEEFVTAVKRYLQETENFS